MQQKLIKTQEVTNEGRKALQKRRNEHKGSTHKMSDGTLHSNKSHTKTSVKLFHFKDLSAKAKAKGER